VSSGPELRPVESRDHELQRLRDDNRRLRLAAEEANDAADARNRFLAHVSHELRTPMNSILGMTRLTLSTELTSEQREYLTVIDESTDALLTLVNDLLDQAKIDAGRLELERIPFRLDDLVASALRGVRVMTDHKGLRLDYRRHVDLPDLVVGDPTRLRQVLLNLVSNAAKFTHTGGIIVAVEPRTGGRVGFAVTDTGIGIPESQLQTIFEEFHQADHSTTRRYGGTGLGLSISARIVELMGGHIDVVSDVGVGSTFRFEVDLQPAEVATAPTPRRPAEAVVLWLTDEQTARRQMLAAVADRGMLPETLTSVETALGILQTADKPPAAIVVDQQVAALDVAWELGREAGGVPIVVVTPGGQRGDGARCREIGVAGYLTGPTVPGDVADTLEAVIAGVPELVTRHWLNERRRSLRVLVADDSATNRTLLTKMLENRGHRTITAANGLAVLDLVTDQAVDVVLLDLHMPELDGYAAAERIRALPGATAAVPIIAVSGSVSDAGRERCRALGIDSFVAKPFHPEHLLGLVERAVAG
jgi:CheY-like chemotaxis protein/nitrogen-specific signal transduction histidine kinase